jgi:hypothetical protein
MIKNERDMKTCPFVHFGHRIQTTHYIHFIRKQRFFAEMSKL